MITLPATVQGGVVKLPKNIQVADGSRVMITILMPRPHPEVGFLPEEILNEDLEFVRACRGRLANQQTHLIQPMEVNYLEQKLGEIDSELLAEVLLAIAWTIDLFDTAQ